MSDFSTLLILNYSIDFQLWSSIFRTRKHCSTISSVGILSTLGRVALSSNILSIKYSQSIKILYTSSCTLCYWILLQSVPTTFTESMLYLEINLLVCYKMRGTGDDSLFTIPNEYCSYMLISLLVFILFSMSSPKFPNFSYKFTTNS